MRDLRTGDHLILVLILFGFLIMFSGRQSYASTISGIVYDNRRNPLIEVDIELLDDLYRSINRTKTTATGRYEFGGLGDGRYTVKVLPFRYDLMDETALVEINTMTSVPGQVGNTYMTQDFYLSPRKGSMMDSETGVVFAQDVPKEAKKLYDDGAKSITKGKSDEGIASFRKAVAVFPTYFVALQNLGKQLFAKGEYGEAVQVLLKASEVNPKSPVTFYYMGSALVKLNYNKAALIPLNQALVLAPASVQILLLLGTAEVSEGKVADAEKHLLQARKFSRGEVPEIHWQLAQLYGKHLKRYKEAAEQLEIYLKASKMDDQQGAKIKKVIADLKEKAKGTE